MVMGNFGQDKLMDPEIADSVDFMVERVTDSIRYQLIMFYLFLCNYFFSWKVYRNRSWHPD